MITILISILLLALIVYWLVSAIGSCFDHSRWDQGARPSRNAEIVDIKVEKVKYIKNDAKFKTTILFSDGFRFITHRTVRENHFLTYNISIDKGEVLRRAMDAHRKAVEKILPPQSEYHNAVKEPIKAQERTMPVSAPSAAKPASASIQPVVKNTVNGTAPRKAICPHCGARQPEGTDRCKYCGTAMK